LIGINVTSEGIVPGDLITAFESIPIDSVASLLAKLDDHRVGDLVELTVEREGKTRQVFVELQPGS
jgi:S1-C subfamily serine protease